MTNLRNALTFFMKKRHSQFKTLPFEDQFFDKHMDEDIVENKKIYDYNERNNEMLVSLKTNTDLDADFDDKMKLVTYINDTIKTSDKHSILTNVNCDKLPVDMVSYGKKKIAVNLAGISMVTANPIKEPFTFIEAYKKAAEDFKDYLIFGNNIINKDPNPLKKNLTDLADDDCPPGRVYYYLETLKAVVEYRRKKIGIDTIKLLRFLGCNASPEKEELYDCDLLKYYREWEWTNPKTKKEEKQVFLYHLKPSTGHKTGIKGDEEDATRIYYRLDVLNDQIIVGMIGPHPITCKTIRQLSDKTHRQPESYGQSCRFIMKLQRFGNQSLRIPHYYQFPPDYPCGHEPWATEVFDDIPKAPSK
ncbi:hypothetical protein FACS1894140_4950 [Spirochaetia bacterium]|nr:hypothetical protein FACS1894140_4950 [Spirochaetia bacterium]